MTTAFDPTRAPPHGRQAEHPRLLFLEATTPPAEQPVTLTEAKAWLRVDGTDQDALLTALITSARQWAENYASRTFVTTGWTARFARFPVTGADLYLPLPDLQAVSALTWVDSAGAAQVYDVADLDIEPTFGLLRVKPDAVQDWPQDAFSVEAVYTAGYGAAAIVPQQIQTAIKVAIAQNFVFRTDQVAGSQFSTAQLKSSMSLLNDFKMFRT